MGLAKSRASISGGGSTRALTSSAAVLAESLITTFTRVNGNASNAAGSDQIVGFPLQKGDLSPGQYPFITDNSDVEIPSAVRFLKAGYADGSYVGVHMMMLDSNIAASGSKTYKLKKRGTYSSADRGTDLATLLAGYDLKIEFTSMTETDSGGTRTHGDGSMTFTFADADVSGRVVKLIGNQICERWQFHGYVESDAHLHVTAYLTRWANSDGSLKKLYATGVVSMHEWAVASKKRLDYTATLKDGSTTLGTYTSVEHPYGSEWATIRTNTDEASCRPIATDGTSNTLHTVYDQAYLSACECLVPFNVDLTPDGRSITAYVPAGGSDGGGGSTNMYHRMSIDATGGYLGRSALPSVMDMEAVMLQTATAWAVARGASMVALHVPYHYRLPFGDTPNLPMPYRMNRHDGTAYASSAWTGDGMPTGIDYPSRVDSTHSYVTPEGGTGDWTLSIDSSHAVPYGGIMWIIDGEDYIDQASIDLVTNLVHQAHADSNGSQPTLPFATFTGYSGIPTGQWAGVPQVWGIQERCAGLAAQVIKFGTCFRPNTCTQANFLDDILAFCDDYLGTGIPLLPSGHIDNGNYNGIGGDGYILTSYHQNMNSMHFSNLARLTEMTGFEAVADMLGNFTVGLCDGNRGRADCPRYSPLKKTDSYNSSTNPYQPASAPLMGLDGSVTSDTFSISDAINLKPLLNNNDECYFFDMTTNYAAATIPSGAAAGTAVYIRDLSFSTDYAATFKFSDTAGGSVKTIGNAATVCVGVNAQGVDTNLPSDMGSGDAFPPIALAALRCQEVRGFAGATQTIAQDFEDYLNSAVASPIDWAAAPNWDLRRTA